MLSCVLDSSGISYTQQTAYRGQRSSTSRAFLYPVLARPNLHVTVDSFVTKVRTVLISFWVDKSDLERRIGLGTLVETF